MPLYVLNAFAQAVHHGCNTSVKKKRLHERDILKLKVICSGIVDDWHKLRKIQINNQAKFAKKKFTLKKQGGLHNTWWIINKLNDSNSIHDPYKLSNAFNNHFSDMSPRLANEIHVNENGPSHVDCLCEIYDCIFELKTTSVYLQFLAFIVINYPKQSNRFGQHIFKSYRIAFI